MWGSDDWRSSAFFSALRAFGPSRPGPPPHRSPRPAVCLALLLHGLGVGLFQVAYTDLVIAALPPADRGVAGSLTILTRTVGVVGGASALSAAFQYFEMRAARAGVPAAQAFLDGFQATFGYAAAALALCLAISLLRPRMWA